MRPLLPALLLVFGSVHAQKEGTPVKRWTTKGFADFRKGTFDAGGANLYVSHKGTLQTIHRFDADDDGYFDLVFNNTHDLAYKTPVTAHRFTGRSALPFREFPGVGAMAVGTADLDGDGLEELVVARGNDNASRVQNSWIYWGSPEGWSERRHIELPTPYVESLAIGDLNGDGSPDLAFIAGSPLALGESRVFWNRDGVFLPGDRSGLRTPGGKGSSAEDVDRDGKSDLIVATETGLSIFWGGSDFGAESKFPIGAAHHAVKAGERLAVANAGGISLFTVKGRTLQPERTLKVEGVSRLAVADLDRDGKQEIIAARSSVGRDWEPASRIYPPPYADDRFTELPTQGALDASVGDVDGDGYPDIAFANARSLLSYDINSFLYWGGADGYSAARRSEMPTHGAVGVHAARGAVLFANATTGRPIGDIDTYLYPGSKTGFAPNRVVRLPTIGGYESSMADFDDDGYADLLLVGSHEGDPGGEAGSYIYRGSESGFSPRNRSEVPTRGAIGCATGDVDRDGYLDLVFSNMDDNTVSVFNGGANGHSKEKETILTVKDPRFPLVADMNRDHWPDLLIPSVKEGVVIFWGAEEGFRDGRRTLVPGVGTVSQQVADLDADGHLDLIVCNLAELQTGAYHTVNTYIHWGSDSGFSVKDRSEIPSLGTHHAVVEDFNRDGHLDIFVSNYQSEYTRDIDSYIYWGNRESNYTERHRQALHIGSAAGAMAGDFDGDGWIDLAVSNHVVDGDHRAQSPVLWNGPQGFDMRRATLLPTVGPHMMSGVDWGNIYTRIPSESYVSAPFDAGEALRPSGMRWEGEARHGGAVVMEFRGADHPEKLSSAPWIGYVPGAAVKAARWWQYRLTLKSSGPSSPAVRLVEWSFSR